jgi:hypothetical protein
LPNQSFIMKRAELIELITGSDDFYSGLSFEQLSDDDLIVIWKSIEAHLNQIGGLTARRALEFKKKTERTIFIR